MWLVEGDAVEQECEDRCMPSEILARLVRSQASTASARARSASEIFGGLTTEAPFRKLRSTAALQAVRRHLGSSTRELQVCAFAASPVSTSCPDDAARADHHRKSSSGRSCAGEHSRSRTALNDSTASGLGRVPSCRGCSPSRTAHPRVSFPLQHRSHAPTSKPAASGQPAEPGGNEG